MVQNVGGKQRLSKHSAASKQLPSKSVDLDVILVLLYYHKNTANNKVQLTLIGALKCLHFPQSPPMAMLKNAILTIFESK